MKFRFKSAGAGYGFPRLAGDLSGGMIAALIALPYGLAMASLMGLPPALGILTSILSAPFIALLGRNPVMIGGTSTVTVPFVAAAVQRDHLSGAALLGILSAIITLGFALARQGRHIMRVPVAVISGFASGIGGLLLCSQLDMLLGLPSAPNNASLTPAQQLLWSVQHLGGARLAPLLLGGIVIAAAVACTRLSAYLPAPLIGVILSIAIARLCGIVEQQVGALPAALPGFLRISWSWSEAAALLPSAFGLAFVGAINTLMTSRAVDHFRGCHEHTRPSDADGELRAYGAANLFTGFFGAPPSVGIPARSVAVVKCGGTTPLANLFHATALVLILWLGSPLVARIPMPALAGVTVWMGLGLLNGRTWLRLHHMRRFDALAFVVTALCVLVANSMLAVIVGCGLYALRRWRPAHPRAPASHGAEAIPSVPSATAETVELEPALPAALAPQPAETRLGELGTDSAR